MTLGINCFIFPKTHMKGFFMLSVVRQHGIDLQVIDVKGDLIFFSLSLPVTTFHRIRSCFNQLSEMFDYFSVKQKHFAALSNVNNIDLIATRRMLVQERNKSVFCSYSSFLRGGLDHRSSVMETQKQFQQLNCGQINTILKDFLPNPVRKGKRS